MAVVGLKLVRLALVDKDTQRILVGNQGLSKDGIFEIDHTSLGTKTANITGIEGATDKVFGNNVMQDLMIGAASPSVALEVNDLKFTILQKILGNEPDGKGGYVYSGAKPHVAMLIQSESIDRQHQVYFGFGNGLITAPAQSLGTDTEKQTRNDDKLTFTALDTVVFNNQPMKVYSDIDPNFDKAQMLSEVFGGYKPAPTPPVSKPQ